jgi:spermidine synthase
VAILPAAIKKGSEALAKSAKAGGGTAKAGSGRPAPKGPSDRRPLLILIAIAFVAVAAAAIWFAVPRPEAGTVAETGTEPGLVARVESLYNDIYVYRLADGNYRLSFGAERLRYTESIVDPNDPLALPVYYTQSMTAGLAYASRLDDAAIIGLGGGRTAWYHHKSVPGLAMTAVELDPEVVRLGERFFKVAPEPGFDIAVMDGRVWLSKTDRTFDILLVDAYRGPFVPFHLLTTEFYKLVAARLKPGGVAVQNVEPSTMLFDPAVATIRSAFEHVVFFEGRGNIVVLAYNGPEKDEATLTRQAAERQAEFGFRYDLTQILGRRFAPAVDAAAKPLTDDFAPVEYLKAIERHNEKRT